MKKCYVKILALLLGVLIAVSFVVTGCKNTPATPEETIIYETTRKDTTTTEETSAEETTTKSGTPSAKPVTDTLIPKLLALKGVRSVLSLKLDKTNEYFEKKYIVIFNQPLDWNNPSKGTFPQRVEIGIRKDAKVNAMQTNGYLLNDILNSKVLIGDDAPEIVKILDANFINVEHRFFGKSCPKDLSFNDTKYWEYMTAENSAKDFHSVYTALSGILGDDWISFGASRGGLMTNLYGYYYPDDMRAYVSYVAPCSTELNDERMYDFVYTEIGDITYGKEQAKLMRDTVTAFQVELMKNKKELLDIYPETLTTYMFRDYTTLTRLFDVNVLEFAIQFWQYGNSTIDELNQIMNLPDSNSDEHKAKLEQELNLLVKVMDPDEWACNSPFWPYYVSVAIDEGLYHYNFSYLRNALKKAGIESNLSITPDEEPTLLENLMFTKEQKDLLNYNNSISTSMIESMKTTKANHIWIYGATDPWYGLRMPEPDNPNIKIFIHPTAPHSANILTMPEETKNEIIEILTGLVK